MNNNEVLVEVEHISKKFCKDLKHSLWYGVHDLTSELLGRNKRHSKLRKDEFWAVKDVGFELKRGECLGLIGPNGAGKSTLLKMLNGLIKPDEGSITIHGRVGALIELGAGFNPILTGRENVYVNASILGLSKKEIAKKFDAIVDFAEISDFIDAPVQNYSSGMKVRLGFAVAAQLEPDVLLIDEVLAVGDVGFRMKCYKHILGLMDDGVSIVLVSHNVNQLSRVTDHAVVLDKGQKVFDGPLTKAVGHYETLVRTRVESEKPIAKGTPWIESMCLIDHQGREKTEFMTGENIYAVITLASEKPLYGARLIVTVESPTTGILGSFSTPFKGFHFDLIPPKTVIQLSMPDIPLLIGSYQFNVSLYGPETTEFYDRRTSAATFQIIGPPTNAFGFGVSNVFNFKHKWDKVK